MSVKTNSNDISTLTNPLPNINVESPPNGWIPLRSVDRNIYESGNNFTLTKGTGDFKMRTVNRMAVAGVYYQWSTPNINIRNNVIKWTEGINTRTAIVPEGFYNISDFKTALEIAMNAVSSYTITLTANTIVKGYSIDLSATGSLTFIDTGLRRDIVTMLGWIRNEQSALFLGKIPELYYTRYVDVCSNTLNQYQYLRDEDSNGKTTDIITRVYSGFENVVNDITYSPYFKPSLITYQNNQFKWMMYVRSRVLGSIDIKLYDEHGDFLYISPQFGDPTFVIQLITEQ
jgi:hypothetical protein